MRGQIEDIENEDFELLQAFRNRGVLVTDSRSSRF